jgi:multiple sugar transport system ATP-binding protein
MAEIKLIHLTKRWGDFVGVDDQTIYINDKEFFVLLGPSGCGKTTTMRMIAGLEDPTDGEIWIGDRIVNDDLPKDRDVAMVFQNYGLYPHLSVYENIAYPLKVRGTPRSEIQPRVEKVSRQVELTDFLHRKPRELSGGQRQRVALARAIVRKPQVFLMDEPLSNLDAKLRVTMRAELKHLSHELQITTVYVTHDQIEAMTLADRIAVMRNGVVMQLGTPEEIYNDPANIFVASFIGSPAMNLVEGSIENGFFITSGGAQLAKVGEGNVDRVILGVRAEDFVITEIGQGDIDVPVYATENTGDSTLLTVEFGKQRVTAKGDRHVRKDINDLVGLRVKPEHLYVFDPVSENRIRF